ncbi:hypothetical protein ABTZ44_16795 [Microbacterium oxydans]|uniref:hypothetical protein n=1 Tax=Microbacterium TaxID=33882 RepID=UPI002592E6EF|nr:hypothetical protein [uncultured Microbacterium sp.]
MATQPVEVESFHLAVRDPFLEALIRVVSEPNGSSTAQQAYEATRDWWDEHSAGPTAGELLDAMFEPTDWLSVIDDHNRPLAGQEAQVELMRSWLLLYWCRLGAISFVAGVDLVVRPGTAVLSGVAKPSSELGVPNGPLDN